MRSVRFTDPAGATRIGEWTDDGIEFGGTTHDPDDVDILPPSEPSKIVCVGLNYNSHAEEADMEIPDRPMLFLKTSNTLAGHSDTIPVPIPRRRIDYEGEIGVIIGEQCKHVAEEDAMDVVAGYTCVNDLSDRHEQFSEENWVRGKSFDGSCPVGPVMATPDEVPDPVPMELRVNGEVKQESTTDDMIFSIPEIIAEVTTYLTLERGDVIATGTPGGIHYLDDGDTVEVEIEGVGTLEHTVVADGK